MRSFLAVVHTLIIGTSCPAEDLPHQIDHLLGEMAGELTSRSVILQSRLTAPRLNTDGDVPGVDGVARFQIARTLSFDDASRLRDLLCRVYPCTSNALATTSAADRGVASHLW